jgi:GDP-mannose 6-dehydrogenase
VNQDQVDLINRAQPPIIEPGLEALLEEVVATRKLSAPSDTVAAIRDADVALLCVGTPGVAHGRPDVSAIERVGVQIGRAMASRMTPLTVVIRSTVLPGTTERVLAPALARGAGRREPNFARLAVNPEFMREGTSIRDFEQPPLVLVGSEDPRAAAHVASLYDDVEAPVITTGLRTAELVKFACNAFHGLKICFANEMADLCDALGADAQEVMRIFRADHKLNISESYLRPGFAFGGSCLPKDLRALVWAARAHEVDVPILSSILPSNTLQIEAAVDRVLATRKRRVGVVGLSFKPDTDDLRESPVVTLVERLIGKGLDVRIIDANVSLARLVGANRRYIESEIPHLATLLSRSPQELADHAEVVVFGHRTPEAMEVRAALDPRHIIVDLTRGALSAPTGLAGGELVACPQA